MKEIVLNINMPSMSIYRLNQMQVFIDFQCCILLNDVFNEFFPFYWCLVLGFISSLPQLAWELGLKEFVAAAAFC